MVGRRHAILQLSGTVFAGSFAAVLVGQGVLTPAGWSAAGQPQQLSGSVKAAVDSALNKFVVKSKV